MAERTGLEPATSGVTGQHSNQLNYRSTSILYQQRERHLDRHDRIQLAERTGLEPATSGVTGQHSNQLNYRSALETVNLRILHGKSLYWKAFIQVAERTGLEPATSGVTGQHSNQLNYRSVLETFPRSTLLEI